MKIAIRALFFSAGLTILSGCTSPGPGGTFSYQMSELRWSVGEILDPEDVTFATPAKDFVTLLIGEGNELTHEPLVDTFNLWGW